MSTDSPILTDLFIPPAGGESSNTHLDVKVRSGLLGGDFSVMEGVMKPKELLAPHTHEHEDQVVLVLNGALWFELGGDGGQVFRAPAGSYVVKPRGISHSFWNESDETVRYVELSGRDGFERFIDSRAERSLLETAATSDDEFGVQWHIGRIPGMMLRHGLKSIASVEMPWDALKNAIDLPEMPDLPPPPWKARAGGEGDC